MKKAFLLIMTEIIVVIFAIFLMNLLVFHAFSLSLRPLSLLLKMAFSTRFKIVSWKTIVTIALIFVCVSIQYVFFFQAIRKSIYENKNKNTHSQGTSRWATDKELIKMGMAKKNPEGIVLGQTQDAKAHLVDSDKVFEIDSYGKRIISDNSSKHALIVGATGSGKGVGVIMPTLLTWQGSVIIVDPKGESYEYTAGYRSQFSDVFYFNPTDEKRSCHINPLDFIVDSPVNTIGNLAIHLHPNMSSDQPYWDKVPRMIHEMMLAYEVLIGEDKSLPEGTDMLFSEEDYSKLFSRILAETKKYEIAEDNQLYPLKNIVIATANQLLCLASGHDKDQFYTHMLAVREDLKIYQNARNCLSSSDFSIKDVMDGKRPISLYLCVPVSDLELYMPMFKLIYTMLLKPQLGNEQNHKHKLLLVLDEFSQFKKFEIISEQIPFVRSFGIRIMAFVQSIAQLQQYYGADGARTLLENFEIKTYLRANSYETGEYFEKLLGRNTQMKTSVSFSKNRKSGIGIDGTNESTSEIGRSLLTATEILDLPGYEEIIFKPGLSKYKAKKLQYFSDARFMDKVKMPIIPPQLKPYTVPKEHRFPTTLSEKEIELLHQFSIELGERNKKIKTATKGNTFGDVIDNALNEIESNIEVESTNTETTIGQQEIKEDQNGVVSYA